MKFYLASRYSRRDELRGYRNQLLSLGHQVTSRWLDTVWESKSTDGKVSAAPPEYRREWAANDFQDIDSAHAVISFSSEGDSGRGGRHVEFGIGLALEKRMILIGEPENVFHCHPAVECYQDWQDFMERG